MLGDIVNAAADAVHGVVHFFQTLAPGGFGLILVPLIVLGLITIWVARRHWSSLAGRVLPRRH